MVELLLTAVTYILQDQTSPYCVALGCGCAELFKALGGIWVPSASARPSAQPGADCQLVSAYATQGLLFLRPAAAHAELNALQLCLQGQAANRFQCLQPHGSLSRSSSTFRHGTWLVTGRLPLGDGPSGAVQGPGKLCFVASMCFLRAPSVVSASSP